MTYQGVDTAARITAAQAAKLRDEGVSFVGRYLVPADYGKALTAQEIKALREAGLAILLCWEIGGGDMAFGIQRGVYHGALARQLAEGFGVPAGTAIYFAADYDVPDKDLIQCEQYIRGAQTALGKYTAGIYGGEKVVEFLTNRGVTKAWQCVAWTNKFLDTANVRQYAWQGADESKAMAAKVGFAVDMDSCEDMRKAGLWMPYNEYVDGDGTIIENVKPKPQPWYQTTVEWAQKEGIVTEARPTDYATRAEVMQMIRNYNRRFDPEDDYSIGTKG